jgi:DNA-binding SARP family transcriptional activator/tetratricopeptide (TPR) repeat protein
MTERARTRESGLTQFRLLGDVAALVDGHPVGLGPARQRCVLAALAVDVGRVVPVDRLTARVWGDEPPLRARVTLLNYLSRLRQVLGPEAIARRPGGYALEAGRSAVDLYRFHDLCARARDRGADDRQAVELLEQALGLWRGEALTGVSGDWATAERDRLHQERMRAEGDLVDGRLRLGHGGDLVAGLSTRAAAFPHDERVAGQYMLALHRAGRTSDALEHYRQVRAHLVDRLGTDPGAALRHLHQRILDADPTLDSPTPRTAATKALGRRREGPLPRQLPAAPPRFTGRAAQLAVLTTVLSPTAEESTVDVSGPGTGDTPAVCVIAGPGGSGKTWLAVHWAHEHADRFPDGQLFVDLHGFSPSDAPMDPATALRGFLDALGVEPGSIPPDQHAQAALLRSLLADRRMLIVADNARDTHQVLPLLPGSPTCAVVVTSRNQLTELRTRHGARQVPMDMLNDAEAGQVLTARIGAERVAAEPGAAAELLGWCGGFPLALGIVAGRAASYPDFPLDVLAAELRDTATRLEVLDDSSPTASLPAVLSWSHKALTAEQARVFELAGLAPGPDLGLHAAASLTGLPTSAVRTVLRALEDMHQVQQHLPGRWRMHDLIGLYAADRARQDIPAADREAALRRLTDFHLHTAYRAERLLNPHRDPVELAAPAPGCSPQEFPDQAAALAWFAAEHHVLLASQQLAADRGWHATVWQLAWALNTYQLRRGHFPERLAMWRAGRPAADHADDPAVRILASRLLGGAAAYAGLTTEGVEHLTNALTLARQAGDRLSEGYVHQNLTRVYELRGEHQRALEHAQHALQVFRELDLPVRQAIALNSVGWFQAHLGDHDAAHTHCAAALELARAHHHREIESTTLDSLGFIAGCRSRYAEALDYYRQALDVYRTIGNTNYEANTFDRIGQTHRATGDHDKARAAWRRSVELYRIQHRMADAQRVQRQLDDLTDRTPDR